MAGFQQGDYVWAKLTGYPFWPAKISSEEQLGPKGPCREVTFLGTKQRATIPEKSIKAINEDRVKMVKQNKTVKFLQAVAEVNTLSPPPASMLNALQDLLNKKGKKGKKRKGEEIATGTKDDAKKAKVEKSNPSILAQTKVSTNKSKKLTTSSQEGTLNSPPSGDKNETLIASFERSQSETDGDSRVYSSDMAKQYIKYGFIGLGAMGYEMVCNLLKGGCNVTVWNRTVAKVDELVGKGARKGDSAAAVAKQCDVTFACLSSPEICKEVVIGPNGIINGISSGKGYVEMSTVDPETSKELEKAVVAAGGRYLEAPVLGSVDAAQSRQLIIMAAGNPALFDEVQHAFDAISTKSYFYGETGNASKMKLVINTMIVGVTASLSESMALAKKCGVSQQQLHEVLDFGPLGSRQIRNKGLAILEGKYSAAFTVDLMQKDMRLALALAKEHKQKMPITSASTELLQQLQRQGDGNLDYAAMYKILSKP